MYPDFYLAHSFMWSSDVHCQWSYVYDIAFLPVFCDITLSLYYIIKHPLREAERCVKFEVMTFIVSLFISTQIKETVTKLVGMFTKSKWVSQNS